MSSQGVGDPEYVDIDPSIGSWRPSPIDEIKPKAPKSKQTADPNANAAAATVVDATSAAAAAPAAAAAAPSLKKEVDPNAPTFYDLTQDLTLDPAPAVAAPAAAAAAAAKGGEDSAAAAPAAAAAAAAAAAGSGGLVQDVPIEPIIAAV